MRFLLMIKTGTEQQVPPSPELMEAIGKLTQEMMALGVLVDTGGMQDSKSATTLTLAGGKIGATDGPFTEANEIVGGYAIVDVKSKDEALALARKFLDVHGAIMGPSFTMETEVRRMYIPSDFSAPS